MVAIPDIDDQQLGLAADAPFAIHLLSRASRSDHPNGLLLLWRSRTCSSVCLRSRRNSMWQYIVSANLSRRDISKGQQALALIYPGKEQTAAQEVWFFGP